ncbi:unnamed protein product [Rotaria sp. Silwood1]|nr:unnamed protein product [Rotaria sp. Silwood1]
MLSPFSSTNNNNDSNIIDLLYKLCKDNEIEKVRSLLPFIGNINIINRIENSTGSTCLHVACYYGHREMVEMLLEYGAVHSIRNIRYNLTPYEEAQTDDIKQLILEHQKLFSNNDYDYIEWSVVGDDLLGKRREFREAIDVYKTYDNHHLMSKLLAEVIHYYLNEYLVNQINDTKNPEDQITRKQIETIESYFKEAIEKQDYLTYFIKAYTLTNFFYKVLNRNLALYILEYFDETKTFSSNYRLVNCLVHIVTLLIYNPNLPQYQYQGICYRGMRITQNDLDQYQLNQHILNRTFLSTSTDHQVAAMFAEEDKTDNIKQLILEHKKLFSNNDYDYIEWSVVGDDLLGKRREFREAIDVYKTYDNHHLISKLLAEVIHYYLNEYLVNQINDTGNPEDQITRKQIETIETYFKEAIEKQDYLTYFIKAYTLTNFFYKVLNKNLALYILEYFDETKTFSSNYRLVNCLVHIVTLLIYHPNLPQYQYQGICYRGMRITQNDLDQYQLNQHILNRAFLSTSTDRQVAAMFAGEGQQSKMRYTTKDHCALQYSCLCQYLIKQNSTAINVESLSTRPDEKEVLIIPFSVFKVIEVKRNYLDDSTASISIEIELEECEDVIDNNKELESDKTSRSSSLSSYGNDIKDTEDWNARPYLNRDILTTFPVTHVVIRQLTNVISVMNQHDCIKEIRNLQDSHMDTSHWPDIGYHFLICNDNDDQQQIYRGIGTIGTYTSIKSLNMFKSLIKCGITKKAIVPNFTLVGHESSRGCPNILNRSSWNARPYLNRDILTTFPVTHVVIRQLTNVISVMNQHDCIKEIRNLQDSQMDISDWPDIGYHFLICNDNDDQQQIYRGIGTIGTYTSIKSLNMFKSLIKCGITKKAIVPNFTLVGHESSRGIYEYYLEYFKNDPELQYSNQAHETQIFCQ